MPPAPFVPAPAGAEANPPPGATIPPPEKPTEALARAEAAAKAKRFGEAEGICRDILMGDPNNAQAFGMLGAFASRQGRIEQAIALMERAVVLDEKNGAWHGNLCELYRLVYRLDDAMAAGQRALQLSPPGAIHLVRFAKVLVDRGEDEDALRVFLAALAQAPEDANAHLGIGQILLARGDFHPGWIEYEWRNRLEQARGMVPRMKAPTWSGMNLPQGRILLISDQGYGDSIQFARYIPLVAEKCREVVLACSAELSPLLSRIPGITKTFNRWQDGPSFTAYSLLSSLPYVLGTRMETIPSKIPYLEADPEKLERWAKRLSELFVNGKRRVGIFWSGRPTHPNNRRRSLRLQQMAPILAVEGVQFFSLQKEVAADEAPVLAGMPNVTDLSKELADFGDTAAAISHLDLVISVDSAVVHLAGALGKPVWVLTPRPSDFRWLLDREDSPWYPSMRLFRQPAPGAWDAVINGVAETLRTSPLHP